MFKRKIQLKRADDLITKHVLNTMIKAIRGMFPGGYNEYGVVHKIKSMKPYTIKRTQ